MVEEIRLPRGQRLPLVAAAETIGRYCTENAAAVALYDRTNPGPHDEILPIDVLSLAALNAFGGMSPMTVMAEVWNVRADITAKIKRITTEDFSQLSDDKLRAESERVCEALNWFWEKGVPQWGGGTRPAKLLHRLRPNIIPIWDERVGVWYRGPRQSWEEFVAAVHADVRHPETRRCLLRINQELNCQLPLLRLWDILLWKSEPIPNGIRPRPDGGL